MLFIGSRQALQYISSDFRNVWTSFIREFNRSFPRKTRPAAEVGAALHSLLQKAEILRSEAIRRTESIPLDTQWQYCRHCFTGLLQALEELVRELREFEQEIPQERKQATGSISYASLKLSLASLELKIQNVKAAIAVAAQSQVRASRRKFLKEAAILTGYTAAGVIASLSMGAAGVQALRVGLPYLARNLPLKKKDGLVILVSYFAYRVDDTWLRSNAELFIPLYVARVELAFGQKANIVKKQATQQDFFDALKDDSIQNIVLFGHGSWYSWTATDGEVHSTYLWSGGKMIRNGKTYDLNFPQRKRGLLVRHTCGEGQEIKPVKSIVVDKKLWWEVEELAVALNLELYPNYLIKVQKNFLTGALHGEMVRDISFFLVRARKGKEWIPQGPEGGHLYAPHFNMLFSPGKKYGSGEAQMEYLLREKPTAQRVFADLTTLLEKISKNSRTVPAERLPLLGTPVFRRENIKGWNRTASPFDFMLNVFGQAEKKKDKLYAMR